MLDSPIASGSAKATNNSVMVSPDHTARAPTCAIRVTQTSTRASSWRSPTWTCRHLLRLSARSGGTRPVANRPAASPVTVASRRSGKTLLVPVDRVASGIPGTAPATTRWVPSPPSTTISRAPAAAIARAAVTLSSAPSCSGMSTNSSRGHGGSRCAWWVRTARITPALMPVASGIISTRVTPSWPSGPSRRWIMLAFSAVGNTEALAVRRRMSRPEAGLATMPTTISGVAAEGTGRFPQWLHPLAHGMCQLHGAAAIDPPPVQDFYLGTIVCIPNCAEDGDDRSAVQAPQAAEHVSHGPDSPRTTVAAGETRVRIATCEFVQ